MQTLELGTATQFVKLRSSAECINKHARQDRSPGNAAPSVAHMLGRYPERGRQRAQSRAVVAELSSRLETAPTVFQ